MRAVRRYSCEALKGLWDDAPSAMSGTPEGVWEEDVVADVLSREVMRGNMRVGVVKDMARWGYPVKRVVAEIKARGMDELRDIIKLGYIPREDEVVSVLERASADEVLTMLHSHSLPPFMTYFTPQRIESLPVKLLNSVATLHPTTLSHLSPDSMTQLHTSITRVTIPEHGYMNVLSVSPPRCELVTRLAKDCGRLKDPRTMVALLSKVFEDVRGHPLRKNVLRHASTLLTQKRLSRIYKRNEVTAPRLLPFITAFSNIVLHPVIKGQGAALSALENYIMDNIKGKTYDFEVLHTLSKAVVAYDSQSATIVFRSCFQAVTTPAHLAKVLELPLDIATQVQVRNKFSKLLDNFDFHTVGYRELLALLKTRHEKVIKHYSLLLASKKGRDKLAAALPTLSVADRVNFLLVSANTDQSFRSDIHVAQLLRNVDDFSLANSTLSHVTALLSTSRSGTFERLPPHVWSAIIGQAQRYIEDLTTEQLARVILRAPCEREMLKPLLSALWLRVKKTKADLGAEGVRMLEALAVCERKMDKSKPMFERVVAEWVAEDTPLPFEVVRKLAILAQYILPPDEAQKHWVVRTLGHIPPPAEGPSPSPLEVEVLDALKPLVPPTYTLHREHYMHGYLVDFALVPADASQPTVVIEIDGKNHFAFGDVYNRETKLQHTVLVKNGVLVKRVTPQRWRREVSGQEEKLRQLMAADASTTISTL